MNLCVTQHEEHHAVVRTEPDGRVTAFICRRCGWLLQKDVEDWHVVQRFAQQPLYVDDLLKAYMLPGMEEKSGVYLHETPIDC